MEGLDQRKTNPAGHESHGVHLCRICGWPFPNPHPSAKHRRAHKRICGTIEGYKLIDSGDRTHSAVADNEHGSDEDRRTPSPKIESRSTNEFNSVEVGERSSRSETDVFSDAVSEFSDSVYSPVYNGQFEGARGSETNVKNAVEGDPAATRQLETDATAGVVQLPNSPTNSSQMHNPEVLYTETSPLGSAIPVFDKLLSSVYESAVSSGYRTDELADGLANVNGSAGDLSHIKSQTVKDSPEEDPNINVCDHELQSSAIPLELEIDVKGNEGGNTYEFLSDGAVTPCKIANEASDVGCKLKEMDLETSDSVAVDQILELKEEQRHELGPTISLHNPSPDVKSCEHEEILVNIDQIVSDSAQYRDVGSHGDSNDGSYIAGDGTENDHVLSVANEITAVDHPEIMLEDFKDHKTEKFELPVTLDLGEGIVPVVADNQDNVCEENHSSFLPTNLSEKIHIFSPESTAWEGNLKQEEGDNCILVAEVPVERKGDTSELKVSTVDFGSSGGEIPSETHMSEKIQTDSSEYHLLESAKTGLLDVIPVALSPDETVSHKNKLSGGDNPEKVQTEKYGIDGKDSGEVVEEELPVDIKTTESLDDLCTSKVDQTTTLRCGNSGGHEKAEIEFSDRVENESQDVAVEGKINSEMTLGSACYLSEPIGVAEGMDKAVKNLQETEPSSYFATDSREAGPDASNSEIKSPNPCGSKYWLDAASQKAMKVPKFNSTTEVKAESVGAACEAAKSNNDSGAEISPEISHIAPEQLVEESGFTTRGDDSHRREDGFDAPGISIEYLVGDEKNQTKKLTEVPAVDVSVDSSSQTDSLEGNWGSVSVLSTQSDAVAALDAETLPSTASEEPAHMEKVNLQKAKTTSEEHHSNQSDVSEAPSLPLVEAGDGVDQKPASYHIQTAQDAQQPKSEALQAGWFPSFGEAVNEPQGRRKSVEIIDKVTNWSTGKQRTPLKNLLGEANLETKPKPSNPKQPPTVTSRDENTTTVNSILAPEANADQVAKREMGREWSSPARYPSDIKKEKRKVKGRPYWVPFICCSSVN